ncbi:MAG: alpha/beta hydrolase [Prochlorococcus sp.]
MKQIIAMHGWSGDSSSWMSWNRHFEARGWIWQSAERGYGGMQQRMPCWMAVQATAEPSLGADHRRVVIGHSLGPHLLRSETFAQATDVVLLASFGRFAPQGADGRALRAGLKGMQDCLGTAQEAEMLQTFLTRAAKPWPLSAIPASPLQKGLCENGRVQLKQDLIKLIQTDGLPAGLPSEARVLVVDGEQDSIVAPAARAEMIASLNHQLRTSACCWQLPGIGHALLVPELIERVCTWLEAAD